MVKGLAITGIIFLFAAGALAFAGSHRFSPEERIKKLKKEIALELNLNTEQTDHLDRIATELLEKGKQLRSEHEAGRKAFMGELIKDKVDTMALTKMVSAKTAQVNDMASFFIARLAEFHETLSKDQREKLIVFMDKHHQEHRGRFCSRNGSL